MPIPEKTIALVGFKASGKSTVGRLLAKRLARPFADTDRLVEEAFEAETGEPLPFREIYRLEGREKFGERERTALRQALGGEPMVLSFGGGTLTNAERSGVDLSGTVIVALTVEKEALYRRMLAGGVPAFLDPADPRAAYDALWEERTPLFAARAAFTVENEGRAPADTVDEIVRRLEESSDDGR